MNEVNESKLEGKRLILAATIPILVMFVCWMLKILEISLDISFSHYGIYPRDFHSWTGLIMMPLIHGDIAHIAANTVAFIVLVTGVFYFYKEFALKILLYSWIFTGLLTWLIGREAYHIGASGLVYAFAGFIFLSGVLRNHIQLMAISLLVVFVYGSMIWGIFPIKPQMSWEGHLSGLVTGFCLAYIYRKQGPQRKIYTWDDDDDDNDTGVDGGSGSSHVSTTHKFFPEYDYKENE
ncbi:MAG: rhomboid family intramembrane serine protease [Bacteroidales bacterium]|nr:rhomboid family intramembrane serine protease [Bacteroidales bacterium]